MSDEKKKAEKERDKYGEGVLWYAKKRNGHSIQVYRCLSGRFHNFAKRDKTYAISELEFTGPVSFYSGPDPKQYLKE